MGNWLSDAFGAIDKTIGWDTIGTIAASSVGFALGGPAGAFLLGGAVSTAINLGQGDDIGDALLQGAADGALGMIGGGVLGAGLKSGSKLAVAGNIGKSLNPIRKSSYLGFGLKAGTPHYYRGILGAGLGAGASDLYSDLPAATDNAGEEAELGAIPVTPISGSGSPEGMPDVLMPDNTDPRWPAELVFTMQETYKTLPDLYGDVRKSFGKDPTETSLPEEPPLPANIDGEDKAGIKNYPERVEDLGIVFTSLRAGDQQVAEAVKRTAEYCDAGISDIDSSINTLGGYAKIHPENGPKIQSAMEADLSAPTPVFGFPEAYMAGTDLSENNYALSMVEGVYAGVESIMNSYAQLFAELGAEIENPETPEEPETPTTPTAPTVPTTPTAPTVPTTPTAPGPDNSTLEPPKPIDLGGSDDSAAGSAADRANEAAQQQLEQMGRDAAAAQAAAAPMAGTAGSGLESMMLPMMMQAMMGAMGGANQQRAQVPDEPRRRRREDENQPQAPAAAPVPGGVPQAAAPPTSAPPAGTQPPAARPPAPPATQGPATPGKPPAQGEGNIVYTFPDGRTQEVSAVVAQALDAAFGNASRTDAKEAYANTKITWTDEKEIGTRVDPSQLMTGDVGVWDGRTALLVVFGTDTSGTLEAVVDGQLQPVVGPAEMRDGQGEFGAFVGFFHPPGIEKSEAGPAVAAEAQAALPPEQVAASAPA